MLPFRFLSRMPSRPIFAAAVIALALLRPVSSLAQNEPDPFDTPAAEVTEPVKISLVSEQDAIVPGQPFTVALRLEHAKHWHTYWVNSGELGKATTFTWKLPEGFTASEAMWPVP